MIRLIFKFHFTFVGSFVEPDQPVRGGGCDEATFCFCLGEGKSLLRSWKGSRMYGCRGVAYETIVQCYLARVNRPKHEEVFVSLSVFSSFSCWTMIRIHRWDGGDRRGLCFWIFGKASRGRDQLSTHHRLGYVRQRNRQSVAYPWGSYHPLLPVSFWYGKNPLYGCLDEYAMCEKYWSWYVGVALSKFRKKSASSTILK